MDHLFNTFMHSVAWHSGTMFVKMLGPVAINFKFDTENKSITTNASDINYLKADVISIKSDVTGQIAEFMFKDKIFADGRWQMANCIMNCFYQLMKQNVIYHLVLELN